MKLLAVAPAIGVVVVGLVPRYHWRLSGAVPVATTLSVAVWPAAIVRLCGCVVIAGATPIAIVAVAESAVPNGFDTRTQ